MGARHRGAGIDDSCDLQPGSVGGLDGLPAIVIVGEQRDAPPRKAAKRLM